MTTDHIKRLAEPLLKQTLGYKEVALILGARQVGKTTLIKSVFPPTDTKILTLDFPTDLALLQSLESLDAKEAYKRLGSPKYLVIDEAQRYPKIGTIVKSWYDSNLPVRKMVISGSSSLNIVDNTAEALTGRNEKLELPPLLYTEILKHQDWFTVDIKPKELEGAFNEQAKALLMQHMVYGSYPASIYTINKEMYLTNLATDYLIKDILQLADIREPEILSRLLIALAYQIGNTVSVHELANNLGISRQTVDRYLDLLEASYIIFRLPPFSRNHRKELFKSHKIYFWDTGVRNALINNFSLSPQRGDIGPLFENYVITEFKKFNILHANQFNLYFWQNKDRSEVDLVLTAGEKMWAYEIKWSDSRITGRAFTNEYRVDVNTITHLSAPVLFYQLLGKLTQTPPV